MNAINQTIHGNTSTLIKLESIICQVREAEANQVIELKVMEMNKIHFSNIFRFTRKRVMD